MEDLYVVICQTGHHNGLCYSQNGNEPFVGSYEQAVESQNYFTKQAKALECNEEVWIYRIAKLSFLD